ncbi:alpha-amylase family glycosyl hydrolase [Bifidobacterium animalis]|uniref:alpha-amylase family glycosyl hydrolase n=1 Tax=Bifidobacterium animalis TaxID=28025 RepID=UPI0039ED0BB6
MTANNMHDDWWKQAVVYQVYPRSFRDANGDGLGDIAGITEQVPYLKHLGVDAIWLSPFYPSELADGGYDVIDYRNVDPRLGTLEDFDELVTALHAHGMKIVVDIVPNHTSNMHEWFQAALTAEPGSPERDRYIFREGRGEHGELPPNDWQSLFGGRPGNAWPTANGICTSSQWSSRTLNWKNPEVHEDFKKTLRFWWTVEWTDSASTWRMASPRISTANPSPRWTRTACSTPTIAMGTTRCGPRRSARHLP